MGKFSPPSKKEIREAVARHQANFNRQEDNKLAAIRLAGENQLATQKLQNAGIFANEQERNRGGLAEQNTRNAGMLAVQNIQETGASNRQNNANANALELAGRNNAASLLGERLRVGADLAKAGVDPQAIGNYVNSARTPQSTTQQVMNTDMAGGIDARPQGTMSLTIGGNGIRNNLTGQQVNTQAARLAGTPGLNTSGLVAPGKPIEQSWQSFDKATGYDKEGNPLTETLLVDKNSGRVMRPVTEQEQMSASIFDQAAQGRKNPRPQRRSQAPGLF